MRPAAMILLFALAPFAGAADSPSQIDQRGREHPPLQEGDQALGDVGQWYVLDVFQTRCESGATMTKLDDGSIVISGQSPVHDTYTLKVRTTLRGITAFRLDAMTDESLPRNGPGRARNGNFTLTQFHVTESPLTGDSAEPVSLTRAEADYAQSGYEAQTVLDQSDETGWSIGNGGHEHTLILRAGQPAAHRDQTLLTFTLHQRHPNRSEYNLGRFRLSATTSESPPPAAQAPVLQPPLVQVGFLPVAMTGFESSNGSEAVAHPSGDLSQVVSNGKGANDVYTLTFQTALQDITAIRIEALADESLPNGGPGRTSNKLAVNHISLDAAPADNPPDRKPVALIDPSADFEQTPYSVSRAIDESEKTFWASDGPGGESRSLAFRLGSPVGHESGTLFTLALHQRLAIGRFRVSLSTSRHPQYITIRPAGEKSAAKQDAAPRDRIERYYNVGGRAWVDPKGHQWLPASTWKPGQDGYIGGYRYYAEIPLDPLLQRGITNIDTFRMTIPNGRYRVALLFAETNDNAVPGHRQFDVHIQNAPVLKAVDPIRATGRLGAPLVHVEKNVAVTAGVLNVDFYGVRPILFGITVIEESD